MLKNSTKLRPSGHIFRLAEKFHNIAELAWHNRPDLIEPIIVNYALCAELCLKAAESKVKVTICTDPDDSTIDAIAPSSIFSTLRGHELDVLFSELTETTRNGIQREFQIDTGQDLVPLLSKCSRYFEYARYSYEQKVNSYNLSDIRNLSNGLLVAVRSLAEKQGKSIS